MGHAEALLAGYEVLQGLYDKGILELLRGLLGADSKVLETAAAAAADAPEAVRAIRNLIVLGRTLAEIDPELLDGFYARACPKRCAKPERRERTSRLPGNYEQISQQGFAARPRGSEQPARVLGGKIFSRKRDSRSEK